jgi:hypothetical protein
MDKARSDSVSKNYREMYEKN